jgi:predicted RNase H-like HicB family nuclease
MGKNPEEYLKGPYSRILIPDENGFFSAEIMEFPGCFSEGKTPDEAMRNLEAVAKSWIEATLEQGQEIPEPFMNQGFGGKIALRLPRSLHRQAVRMAERDNISLNQFLISAIAARIGAEDFYTQLSEKFESRVLNAMTNKIFDLRFIEVTAMKTPVIRNFIGPDFAGFMKIAATSNIREYKQNA